MKLICARCSDAFEGTARDYYCATCAALLGRSSRHKMEYPQAVCVRCHKEFSPRWYGQEQCSECIRASRSSYRGMPRICVDCGKNYMGMGRAKRCAECADRHQREYRSARYQIRKEQKNKE